MGLCIFDPNGSVVTLLQPLGSEHHWFIPDFVLKVAKLMQSGFAGNTDMRKKRSSFQTHHR
jgi:hypothetical protein